MQEWIGIDVCSFPVALRVGDDGDREVQMVIAWPGITRVADVSDDFALAHLLTFG